MTVFMLNPASTKKRQTRRKNPPKKKKGGQMARAGLPAKYIRAGYRKHPRSRSRAMKYAWSLKRGRGRPKAKPRGGYRGKKRYRKGAKARSTAVSRGYKRKGRYAARFARGAAFVCAPARRRKRKRKNPAHRRRRNPRFTSRTGRSASRRRWRKSRKRRRRRRNPNRVGTTLRGIWRTLTTPRTYWNIGIVGLGSLGAVALTNLTLQQLGTYFPQLGAIPYLPTILSIGLSVGLAGLVAKYLTKQGDLRKGIVWGAGVLASASFIRQLVASFSPQAAAYLGDWVSPETGLGMGDWVSPETGLGWGQGALPAPSYIGGNPYVGSGSFYPQATGIPGEVSLY